MNASTVREPEIWLDRGADSPSLNAEVRSQLHAAYGRISQGETVTAVTLLGRGGTGKTHELKCLRRHVHTAGQPGLFAYINVQQFSEGQAVRQQFLRALCDSLVRRSPNGLSQWQQLAIALANHALSSVNNNRKQFAPRGVVDLLSRNPLEQNQAWIDRICETFFRARPDIDDPDLVRAIFWTLCPHQLPYARKWLSNQPIPGWKSDELGLPRLRTSNLESHAWQTTLHLFATIEHYLPIAIAFDCFEHPEIPDPGVQKERVAVGLIKWLGDRLRTRSRRFGVMFVCAMHPDTWELVTDHFGSIARFAHDRGGPVHLRMADAEMIADAVQCWLQTFYQAHNLVPPTPLYPFDRAQIEALVREAVDLHDALDWCADNFQPVETDPLEPIELRFHAILHEIANNDLGDDWAIAQAIAQGITHLKDCDLTLDSAADSVTETGVAEPDKSNPPSDPSDSITAPAISLRVREVVVLPRSRSFPVVIELEQLEVAASDPPTVEPPAGAILRVGLTALTSQNGRQLCAQIDRCAEAIQTHHLDTPKDLDCPNERNDRDHHAKTAEDWALGCLVRPLGAMIPAHWKAAQSYQHFANHDRGLVIEFSLDDIAPLLALAQLEAEVREAGCTETLAAHVTEAETVQAETLNISVCPLASHEADRLPTQPNAIALTREGLAAWVDREHIVIGNAIICAVVGQAIVVAAQKAAEPQTEGEAGDNAESAIAIKIDAGTEGDPH